MTLRRPWYAVLYVQVLIGIVLGGIVGALGAYDPSFKAFATSDWMKALGDGFVSLIKMVITPIIFCTIVSGVAHIKDAASVGRIGVKALVYFEVVSSFALAIGLLVGNIVRPGAGANGTPDANAVASYAKQASEMKPVDFVLHIIPDSVVGAIARGDVLQVLLFAILFGFALMFLGQRGDALRSLIDDLAKAMFGVINIVMRAAPLGAFGAMAYTIGVNGPRFFGNLLNLVLTFYVTSALFVFICLGAIARMAGFSIIFSSSAFIKDELLIVLGTSSSESALPQLMEKLEKLGCSKQVVGLVVPTGYSFNLDGTNIYMTLATLFIAQALGVDLTLSQQLTILVVAMLTSKGASGVTGAGFITLAGTLAVVNPALVPGMAMVLGVDKFMSECRALTNIVGNGIATIVVSASEGELDRAKLNDALRRDDPDPAPTAVAPA